MTRLNANEPSTLAQERFPSRHSSRCDQFAEYSWGQRCRKFLLHHHLPPQIPRRADAPVVTMLPRLSPPKQPPNPWPVTLWSLTNAPACITGTIPRPLGRSKKRKVPWRGTDPLPVAVIFPRFGHHPRPNPLQRGARRQSDLRDQEGATNRCFPPR